MKGRLVSLLHGLTFAAAMIAASVIGNEWAPFHGALSPVAPVAGVALAGLFLGGHRLIPWVIMATVLSRVISPPGLPLGSVFALLAGNITAYLLAAAHLRARPFNAALSTLSDARRFIEASMILAGVSVLVPSALLILSVNAEMSAWRDLLKIAAGVFFGRFTGAAIVGSLILTSTLPHRQRGSLRKAPGAVSCVSGAIAATAIIYGPLDIAGPVAWVLLPPLLLAPFVGGSSLTSKILLIIGVGSVWGTTSGLGPFAHEPFGYSLLQQYLCVMSLTGLLLAATATEKRDKDIAIQRAQDLQFLSESAEELLLSSDIPASLQRCMPGLAKQCDVDLVLYHGSSEGNSKTVHRVVAYGLAECASDAALLASIEAHVEAVAERAQSEQIPDGVVRMGTLNGDFISLQLLDCFPIFYGANLMGILSVGSRSRSAIDPGASKLLTTIAFYITSAGKRLRQELEMRALLESERAARTQAEQADRLKNEFLAILSHELRNPLNAIVGWTQLLQRGKVDSSRAAQIIEQSARLQSQLIEDLLDMSRIARGTLTLAKSPVNFSALVAGACDSMQLLAQEKGIELELHLESEIELTAADAVRINQVVSNLLSNAIKFTPRDGRVSVAVEHDGSDAVLTVTDTGEGIPESFIPHLFDLFRQADQSTTRRHGGLGLGLAIAKHMTEMHGGTIKAFSPGIGKGATFVVRLPKAQHVASAVAITEPERDLKEAITDVALKGRSIVVVEDDAATRELLVQALSDKGATVVACERGVEALEKVRSKRPDLIISDIGMPDMDGYQLLEKVREVTPSGVHLPAIAVTAFARPEDKNKALHAGFDAHISKPVNLQSLEQLAGQLIAAGVPQ